MLRGFEHAKAVARTDLTCNRAALHPLAGLTVNIKGLFNGTVENNKTKQKLRRPGVVIRIMGHQGCLHPNLIALLTL